MNLFSSGSVLRRFAPRKSRLHRLSRFPSFPYCRFQPALEVLEHRTLPGFLGAPLNYNVDTNPVSLALGDFNHDGNLDMVSANDTNPGSVSVLLGNGDGTFQAARNNRVALYPQAVAVGDFNGDGNLDIVTANAASIGSVSILLGNGDGTFQPARNYPVGSYLSAMVVADFNGDGIPDLALADLGNYPFDIGGVLILTGNGDGTFQPPRRYDAGTNLTSLAVADFNGDHIPDLVVVDGATRTNPGSVSVMFGNGDGTLRPPMPIDSGSSPGAVAVGDFNRDGNFDLAVVNGGAKVGISIVLGNGDGTFQDPRHADVAFSPNSIAVGDFNNDGNPDLIVTGAHLRVLLGNGDGSFQPEQITDVDAASSLVVGDFNGDHRLDCAGANPSNDITVRLGNGDGTFRGPSSFGPGGSVVVRDFNRDGIPDLVTANPDTQTVSFFAGNGDGTFQDPRSSPVDIRPYFVVADDLNHDGSIDLVTYGFLDRSIAILMGNGDGTFRNLRTYNFPFHPLHVVIGDFNGDGNPDLAVALANDTIDHGVVRIFLGNGDGSFQDPIDTDTGTAPVFLAVGDFNRDNNLDLAVASSGNQVTILLGNGNGTFQNPHNYEGGPASQAVAVGDFNGDGYLDLAVVTEGNSLTPGGLNILSGNGDGTFRQGPGYFYGGALLSVVAGDFNRDNHLDLAVSSVSGVHVLLGNGDGSFRLPYFNYAVGIARPAVADLNGDGYLDLVTEGVTILLNDTNWSGGAPGTGSSPHQGPGPTVKNLDHKESPAVLIPIGSLSSNGLISPSPEAPSDPHRLLPQKSIASLHEKVAPHASLDFKKKPVPMQERRIALQLDRFILDEWFSCWMGGNSVNPLIEFADQTRGFLNV